MEGEFETPIQTNSSNSFAATTISKESSRILRLSTKALGQPQRGQTRAWKHQPTSSGFTKCLDFNRRSRAAAEVASRSSDPFPWLPFVATWVRTERGPRVNLTDSRTNSVPAERIAFERNALVGEWVRQNITHLNDMADAMLKNQYPSITEQQWQLIEFPTSVTEQGAWEDVEVAFSSGCTPVVDLIPTESDQQPAKLGLKLRPDFWPNTVNISRAGTQSSSESVNTLTRGGYN